MRQSLRRAIALMILALVTLMLTPPSGSTPSCYYANDFEQHAEGFTIVVKTENVEVLEFGRARGDSHSGAYSLRLVAHARGAPACVSFRTPIFKMSLDDMLRYPIVRFWIKASLPPGAKIEVAVWARGETAARRGLAFHEAGTVGIARIIQGSTDWIEVSFPVLSVLGQPERLEACNEFYVEWYVHLRGGSAVILVDDFAICQAEHPAYVIAEVLRSANASAGGAVRVAVYLVDIGQAPAEIKAEKPEIIGGRLVRQEAVEPPSIAGRRILLPSRPAKYVYYIVPTAGKAILRLAYRWYDGRSWKVLTVERTITKDDALPLLRISREIRELSPYEAEVRVKVENVGEAPARWVRLSDLLPDGVYLVSGDTKAWIEEIPPGGSYELKYVVRAAKGGSFRWDAARAIYYARLGEEFWAWGGEGASAKLTPSYAVSGESLPERRFLPRLPEPSRLLYVIDLEGRSLDEQLLACSLAGVVNRERPQVFLRYGRTEDFWLRWLLEGYGVLHVKVTLDDALRRFLPVFKGYVVYDPDLPDTINLATCLAAAYNALIVSPKLEPKVKKLGLRCLFDLRGKWLRRYDMYLWMIKNVLPLMNDRLIAQMHTRVPPPGWDVIAVKLRDYLVATRTLTINLSPKHDGSPYDWRDYIVLEEIYDRYAPPTAILGWWWDEWPNVARASERGFFVVATDHAPNLSVLSAFELEHPLVQPHPEEVRLDPDAVYVTIIQSDGDNLCVDYNLLGGKNGWHWTQASRGTEPLGWEIQPLGAEFAPPVMEYLYLTISPRDQFIAGPSGTGYYYPPLVPAEARPLKYDFDQYYSAILDVRASLVLGIGADDRVAICDYAGHSGFRFVFHGYGREERAWRDAHLIVGGVPWIFVAMSGEASPDFVAEEAARLASQVRDRPLFIVIHAVNWFMDCDDMIRLAQQLEERGFKVVTPEELGLLALEAAQRGLKSWERLTIGARRHAYPGLSGTRTILLGSSRIELRAPVAAYVEWLLGRAAELGEEVRKSVASELLAAFRKGGESELILRANKLALALRRVLSLMRVASLAKELGHPDAAALDRILSEAVKLLEASNFEEAASKAAAELEAYAPQIAEALLASPKLEIRCSARRALVGREVEVLVRAARDGQPIVGVEVRLELFENGTWVPVASTTTRGDGTAVFRIKGEAPGVYKYRVMLRLAGATLAEAFAIEFYKPRAMLRVLYPESVIAGKPYEISVEVVNETGIPLGGIKVVLEKIEDGERIEVGSATTDAFGRASFIVVEREPGIYKYVVRIEDPRYEAGCKTIEIAAARPPLGGHLLWAGVAAALALLAILILWSKRR